MGEPSSTLAICYNSHMAKNKQAWLHRKLKLSHHRHTGKKLSHHHTSYGLLICLMVLTGLILSYATRAETVVAQTTDETISITGIVPKTNQNTCSAPNAVSKLTDCQKTPASSQSEPPLPLKPGS